MKKKSVTIINQEEISSYLKDIRKIDPMTTEREKEIATLMLHPEGVNPRKKKEIEDEIVQANLRFVITIAKDYQGQGLDLADLISEGNIGLIEAFNKFDWSKGYKFISYAVWWIRQSIRSSLNENARLIRLPVNVVQDLYKEKKKIDEYEIYMDKGTEVPISVSLDANINGDNSEETNCLLDYIKNENADRPDEFIEKTEDVRSQIQKILTVLDERERMIVEDYYGLTGSFRTLEEIGEECNLTKERVRQIKERALRKLRNESASLFQFI